MRRQRRPATAARSNGAHSVPVDAVEGGRVHADRRGQTGHVAGERLEHGEAEALVRGGHEHGVGGVDVERHLEGMNAPERQESRVTRRLLRAVEALDGARGVGREEQARLVGRPGRGARAPRRAGSARSGRDRRRTGSTATRRRSPAPGTSRASSGLTAATRSTNGSAARVIFRERGWRRSVPWSVTTCGAPRSASAGHAVSPKCAWMTSKRSPPMVAAQRARRAQVAARREGEDLDLDAVELAQRVDLVAHEAPERGLGAAGHMFVTIRRARSAGVDSRTVAVSFRRHSLARRATRSRLSEDTTRGGVGWATDHGARARGRAPWARGRLAGAAGQGTVEYVALILLVAGLFATVVLAGGGVKGKGIADAVTEKTEATIEGVAERADGRRRPGRRAPTMAPWPHALRIRARARSPSSTPASAA